MATLVREVVIPLANYPDRASSTFVRAIPDSAKSLYLELVRCTSVDPAIWSDPATRISALFEVSLDAGANWQRVGNFEGAGGVHINGDIQQQLPDTESPLTTGEFGLPAGIGRQLRATVTVEAGPIRTQGALELRD